MGDREKHKTLVQRRLSEYAPTRLVTSFKHPLEPGEIGGHGISVARKVLIAHTREPAQREHHLTAASVGNHPHRVVNDLTRRQRDVVIEDTEFIALNEGEADPAHRGLHEPSLTYLLDGAAEPRGPLRQVGRVRGVIVNLVCGPIDPLADVPRSRSHGATMPDATNIAITQQPQLLALKVRIPCDGDRPAERRLSSLAAGARSARVQFASKASTCSRWGIAGSLTT